MNDLLVILAKEPKVNMVKTRLTKNSVICPEDAANIYKELLFNLINFISSSNVSFAICANYSELKYFNTFFNDTCVISCNNTTGVGAKIDFVIKDYFQSHTGKLLLTVSDVIYPTIDIIYRSFDLLEKKDVVIGKSDDGGFYLVGLKRILDIWSNIEWSTPRVFGQLLKNIEQNYLSYSVVGEISEIDTIDDLRTIYQIYKDSDWFKEHYPYIWNNILKLI